jgi:septum formation protein
VSGDADAGRTRLVLASASPRRRTLLERFPIDLLVVPSGVEEGVDADPRQHVLGNARAKAEAVAMRERGLVLGADTTVVLGSTILGKAASREEARAMLEALSGRTHTVLTGLHLVEVPSGRSCSAVERTDVTFCALDATDIGRYLESGESEGVAGAYAIQGRASVFVERIAGDYYNVVGLPLHRVDQLLRTFGVSLLSRSCDGEESEGG